MLANRFKAGWQLAIEPDSGKDVFVVERAGLGSSMRATK
jgi:hypothetical protein